MKTATFPADFSTDRTLVDEFRCSLDSPSAPSLLDELRRSFLIRPRDWDNLPESARAELQLETSRDGLLAQLIELDLLTDYQASRISNGNTFGLILGNYRVLGRLGSGATGVVFKAEHLRLPRLVAIKVVPSSHGDDPRHLKRFANEMWSVAQLQHPNIIGAIDTGEVSDPAQPSRILHYFVMEYVPGQDLQEHIAAQGPLPVAKACDLIYQLASALVETDKHHLIHRDLKPSNVLLASDGTAKLLDFGLARQLRSRMTEPGSALGTIDYLAPEQARDASSVDIRADIYGLGGILFWCLTGRTPFPSHDHAVQDLLRRLSQPPPSARAVRSDIPSELDAVVSQMLAVEPGERYSTPQAVMQALLPFRQPEAVSVPVSPPAARANQPQFQLAECEPTAPRLHQILIVDDETNIRLLTRQALQTEGMQCDEAANGALALEAIYVKRYDLVLTDIDMPEMTGPEMLRKLRETPPYPNLKVIMISGRASPNEMAQLLAAGADDFLSKPMSLMQLRARIKAVLRLKEAQDRADRLSQSLLKVNQQLERNLTATQRELASSHSSQIIASKMGDCTTA